MRVGIIQAYKPIFTSVKKTERNQFVSRPDSFEKAPFNFDKEVDIYYSKLEKSMGIVTPQDVIVKANKVSEKTGVALDDVYNTMAMLSEYSSYKSLQFIENSLVDNEISAIVGVPSEYYENNIPLSNVLSYIGLKNLNIKAGNEAVIVDSNLIENIKNMDAKSQKLFKDYIKEFDIKLLYFDNFENGYNFLNQEKNFEDFTIDVLKKAKKYQKKNGKSINYNVKYVLNGENYKNMKILSGRGQIEVIKQYNIATPESIADNLNSIMPSKSEFKSIIDQIAYGDLNAQKDILKFLNKNMAVVTPKLYGKYLQNIHKQLLEFLSQHGKTMDDVYFVVPSVTKSFMPANYVYAKVNHIENPKYLFFQEEEDELTAECVEQLPENAVAVIVDDCILSGLSMEEEVFPYKELVKTLSEKKNIIFAPAISISIGKNELERLARVNNRDDKVICGKLLPECKMKSKYLTLVYDKFNKSNLTTSVLFPYMGPDFNCEELVPLYEKFFYNEKAQKLSAGEINPFVFG